MAKNNVDGRYDGKSPAGLYPSAGLHARGHHKNHGKGHVSHEQYHSLDHGMKHDHMPARDGKKDNADGLC